MWGLLLNNKNIIVGIVVGLMALYIGVLKLEILNIKDDLDEEQTKTAQLELKLEIEKSTVTALRDSIKTQNAAIDKLKTESDEKYKQHLLDLQAARKTADIYKQQSTNLMKLVPKPGANICTEADMLIDGELSK